MKTKEKFESENYITMNLSRQQHSILGQLHVGILPLTIETGRFCNTKREDRLCKLCNLNFIEDEIHFTLVCPFYCNNRYCFLNNIECILSYSLASMLKYLYINYPRQFAKYVTEIWLARKKHLYIVK